MLEVNYKGYKIVINLDKLCDEYLNPLKGVDTTVLSYISKNSYGGRLEEHGTFCVQDLPYITKDDIYKNKESIIKLLDGDVKQPLYRNVLQLREYTVNNNACDIVNEALIDHYESLTISESRANFIENYFKILGYNTCNKLIQGYCQSSYYNICLVSLKESEEVLENIIESYSFWVFGYVYGFSILSKPSATSDTRGDLEVIDYCYGFLGDDHEKSGLLDCAREFIDSL